jgi:hypothetical protein
MPVSNKYVGDFAYFKDIRDNCFNDKVGEAFFSYMKSLNVHGFYAQRDFPELENKRFAIANLLHSVFKFIKFEYVLKNKGIEKTTPSDFHDAYSQYCKANEIKYILGKNDFIKKLEEVGIKFKKLNGNNFYRLSIEDLKVISDKNKWCCAYDEEETSEAADYDIFDKPIEKDFSMEDYKIKCNNLERRVRELEHQLKQFTKSKLDENII